MKCPDCSGIGKHMDLNFALPIDCPRCGGAGEVEMPTSSDWRAHVRIELRPFSGPLSNKATVLEFDAKDVNTTALGGPEPKVVIVPLGMIRWIDLGPAKPIDPAEDHVRFLNQKENDKLKKENDALRTGLMGLNAVIELIQNGNFEIAISRDAIPGEPENGCETYIAGRKTITIREGKK